MEYRNDLASVLLSGLPDDERDHVVNVIHQVDAEKLRRKRASDGPADTAGDGAALDVNDSDEADLAELDEYADRYSLSPGRRRPESGAATGSPGGAR